MSANDDGRVPSYYKSPYQHWDFAIKLNLNYLEGCTTGYVTRWRGKNGIRDLLKARHYLDKMIETAEYIRPLRNINVDAEVGKFVKENELSFLEHEYIFIICTYKKEKDLRNAYQILTRIIVKAQEAEREGVKKLIKATEEYKPGTPEDGGHHARYEE